MRKSQNEEDEGMRGEGATGGGACSKGSTRRGEMIVNKEGGGKGGREGELSL
jgi:hypothetical protein